jgi:hypothetical protein
MLVALKILERNVKIPLTVVIPERTATQLPLLTYFYHNASNQLLLQVLKILALFISDNEIIL